MATKTLTFKKIENGLIFQPDFSPFAKNNVITFPAEGIAVIYGPNGTGKTSLAKVMSGADNTSIECEYEGINYSDGSSLFHVINDQNNRNIIAGTAQDFLLGSNIKREFELAEKLAKHLADIKAWITVSLKNDCGISSASSKLIALIKNAKVSSLVKDFANTRSKGKNYSAEKLIQIISELDSSDLSDIDEEKWKYFIANYGASNSVLMNVLSLTAPDFVQNQQASAIEEDSVALDVLNHFKHKSHCIVCDNDEINSDLLIEQKTQHRQVVIDALTEQMRSFIEDVLALSAINDPFEIKTHVLSALEKGDYAIVGALQADIKKYMGFFDAKTKNALLTIPGFVEFEKLYVEYNDLISKKPEITEEDFVYIQEIIANSMSKKIAVTRDGDKNLKILLEEKEFINVDRGQLPLSTGEQNFLSLCFEFLKATNSDAKLIVLDDPISSFDSIYKNKIVFAMVKMLEKKPRIILTHNVDLLRLLQAQYKDCFNLFFLNNTSGETNGIIPLTKEEQNMLINLKELLDTFRHKIYTDIEHPELFLISMIPFMRGYANIIDKKETVEALTQLMHGYMTKTVDIADVFYTLFGSEGSGILPPTYSTSVDDILSKTVDGVSIVNPAKYPLLDKTLRHSFTYLFLRLLVEKTLVNKYGINTSKYDQLGAIIHQAFPGKDPTSIRNRVRLTSKKTLINEFNHFEGNLSIFQPAIDITEQSLGKEKTEILEFVRMVKAD